MKKLLLILALIFLSCDKDTVIELPIEPPCECIKTVHKLETYVYFQNNTIKTGISKIFMYKEKVPCQEEISGNMGGDIFFEIKCN